MHRSIVCYSTAVPAAGGLPRARTIMYIADDPTLALITRFMGGTRHLELPDAQYLVQQIQEIEHYVGGFPADERQARALEWIGAYARQYRQQWQKQAVVEAVAHSRCADCPLVGGDRSLPCPIHARWLELLRRYASDEISSHEYAEATLKLLSAYKSRLVVGRSRAPHRFHPAVRQGLLASHG